MTYFPAALIVKLLPTTFSDAVACVIFIVYVLNVLLFMLSLSYGFLKFNILPNQRRKQYNQLKQSDWPGITIIKPLTGVDASLEDNLESYFNLDYPRFELHFCIEDNQDPAVPLVRRLLNKYPNVEARLFLGGTHVGVNPKVNNMTTAYLAGRYDWFMIADTGIWMRHDTLKDMMYCALRESRVGIVHQCPFYRVPSQPTMLCNYRDAFLKQAVFFGTWHAKMYLALNACGFNCATGMSCLYRRDVLQRLHPNKGIAAYADVLAEDFFVAEDYYRLGWKIRMAHQPAWQNPGLVSRELFAARMHRWFQLRLTMMPVPALVEAVFECFPVMLLMSWALHHTWPHLVHPIVFAVMHSVLWMLCDYVTMHSLVASYPQESVHRHPNGTTTCSFLRLWLEQEVTSIPNRISAMRQPVVNWRGRTFRLQWGGKAVEVTPPSVDDNKNGGNLSQSHGDHNDLDSTSSSTCVPSSNGHHHNYHHRHSKG